MEQSAERGADAEKRDADNIELLAPDERSHVGAGGKDDGVGYEIRGENPGGFVLGRAETAGDVWRGDIADRGVKRLHKGSEGNRHGDNPRIDTRAPGLLDGFRCGERLRIVQL